MMILKKERKQKNRPWIKKQTNKKTLAIVYKQKRENKNNEKQS